MLSFTLLVVIAFLVLYILLTRKELPEYYHAQVLLIDLIYILTRGTPDDFDRWALRLQEYPNGRPKYANGLGPAHTGRVITAGSLSSYLGLRGFVLERVQRETGRSLQKIDEDFALEKSRLRGQLDLERQRMTQEFERKKRENEEDLRIEYERLKLSLEHEAAIAIHKERFQEARLLHDRWSNLLNVMSNTVRSIVLLQAELRNNPAAEDIVRNLNYIHEEMKKFDPAVTIDQENLMEIVQKVLMTTRGYGGVR